MKRQEEGKQIPKSSSLSGSSARVPVDPGLLAEAQQMAKLSAPGIKKMMQTGTLTPENVEMLH